MKLKQLKIVPIFFILSLGILLFFCVIDSPKIDALENQKNVLYISSYNESFLSVPEQIKGLQTVFDPQNVNLDLEYMDTKRFSDKENVDHFYKSLQYKLAHTSTYDAVVVGDDAALQFAMDYQNELFKNIPIFFMGINDKQRAEKAANTPNMAGSIEIYSIKDNIDLAYQFSRDAKKIIGIVDGTITGQGEQEQFKSACSSFSNMDSSIYNISNTTFDEFGKSLEKIGDDTIVLFLSMSQDATEKVLDLDEQFQFIKEHTNVPVYRANIGGIGKGIVGGKLVSYEKIGENTANLVMKVFAGESINEIPLNEDTPYYYCFDYTLIKKYHISEKLIPKDTVWVNKEENPLEKYKKVFMMMGVFGTFLFIIACVLIFDNLKRRKIQKELSLQYAIAKKHSKEVSSLYQKYDIAIHGTDSAVWELNIDTEELTISDNFFEFIDADVQCEKNCYQLLRSFVDPDYADRLIVEIERCVKHEIDEVNIQVPTNGSGNSKKWILIRGKMIQDGNEQANVLSGIILDVTALKKHEEYISYYVKHDYVTDMPNLMKFKEVLSSELKQGNSGVVMLLDLDNFKSINDTLGHACGNEILIQIAARFKEISDDHIFAARFGGDEFIILIKNITKSSEIDEYVTKIKEKLMGVYVIESIENYISFSIGITRYPQDSDNIDQLITNADTAMYQVKNNGKNDYVYFRNDMIDEIKFKIEIESVLRKALKEDGFCLYYQPQVNVQTGEIAGYEALLRLKGNVLSPGVFIPIAEESGLIIDIGRWVAKEAIRQLSVWREKGFSEKVVAINYSSKQMRDTGYVEYLKKLLQEYQVKSEQIEIEITESILIENNSNTIEFLEGLKKEGFKIALDDFGTGYSSIKYLTYIPVNKIKLDKSINDKFLESEDIKVMCSIISLVHSLDLKITAEGIEEWDKFMKLKQCNCDLIQGYLFSKPASVEEIEKLHNKNMIEMIKDVYKNNGDMA